jgi:hypothetical protein
MALVPASCEARVRISTDEEQLRFSGCRRSLNQIFDRARDQRRRLLRSAPGKQYRVDHKAGVRAQSPVMRSFESR